MSLRQAAQQALDEMLRVNAEGIFEGELNEAITNLRAALAEPEQEPVAWELRMGKTDRVLMDITNNPQRAQDWRASLCEVVPLYYAPTPRKPLTDEEMRECAQAMNAEPLAEGWPELIKFARAIERAHGIGGGE